MENFEPNSKERRRYIAWETVRFCAEEEQSQGVVLTKLDCQLLMESFPKEFRVDADGKTEADRGKAH